MAKQLVNPIERHAEKAVLGIALLLLIAVAVKYVFSSPNKIVLGGEAVAPRSVDARLAQKAVEIADRIRNASPQETAAEPLIDEFLKQRAPLKADPLPLAVALGPPVPLIDSPEAVVGRATLVQIQRPEKPAATFGRSTLLIQNSDLSTSRVPANWVTVSVVQDVKALSELQRRTWGATKADVVFMPPELERRIRRSDGSWSDVDWTPITPWPTFRLPSPPEMRMTQDGAQVEFHKDDRSRFEKYEAEIAEPAVQLGIIRPLPAETVRDENPWRFPVISSYEEVMKQDDEYLHPKDPPKTSPEDRYGLKQVEPAKETQKAPQTQADFLNLELEGARKLLEDAKKSRSRNDALNAYNIAFGIETNPNAPADLKQKARMLKQEADLAQQDIAHGGGQRPGPQGADPKGAQATVVRDKSPKQQIWVHDAAVGSVASGATYQYRMRVRILNRLAALPESFEDPADAGVLIVASDWSDPVDAVTIPEDSLFFVTRDDPKRREASVEFYRWYDGVWVKSGTAKFTEGEKLIHETRTPVPNLQDRHVADTPLVTFEADAMLMDLDFARPFRDRKSGLTASGVKFGSPENTTAAVFVDSQGRPFERIVPLDKAHPDKRSIIVFTPRR